MAKEVIEISEKLPPCPFCKCDSLEVHGDYMIQCKGCMTVFMQPQMRSKSKQKSMLDVWCNRKGEIE